MMRDRDYSSKSAECSACRLEPMDVPRTSGIQEDGAAEDGRPEPEDAVRQGGATDAGAATQPAVETGTERDVQPGARVGRPAAAQPHLPLAAVQRELLPAQRLHLRPAQDDVAAGEQ